MGEEAGGDGIEGGDGPGEDVDIRHGEESGVLGGQLSRGADVEVDAVGWSGGLCGRGVMRRREEAGENGASA